MGGCASHRKTPSPANATLPTGAPARPGTFHASLLPILQVTAHCAGMVTNGSFSGAVPSASVKKYMIAVSARFAFQSPSSTQNQ
jgi:hypothetical protein